LPQFAAEIEPLGALRMPSNMTPDDGDSLVQMAWRSRPEVLNMVAQVENSRAALALARADRIPVFSIGPAYQHNESGADFYGLNVSSPIPLLNAGNPLVRQREAELERDMVALQQERYLVAAQVRAATAKWRKIQESAQRTRSRIEPIR